jgi:molybdopterin converting factor subunit 1
MIASSSAQAYPSTVTIRLFAVGRDIVGASSVSLPISDGTTVGELLDVLTQQYPALHSIPSLLIAVNGSYAERSTVVSEGDELALIPPVSGG